MFKKDMQFDAENYTITVGATTIAVFDEVKVRIEVEKDKNTQRGKVKINQFLLGYDSSNVMTSLNVPSSKGVSAGPKMTAFQIMRLSAHGAPEMPPGGSVDRRLKSRINRFLDGVDCHRAGRKAGCSQHLLKRSCLTQQCCAE